MQELRSVQQRKNETTMSQAQRLLISREIRGIHFLITAD
jgi:hypothetical protein